MRNAGSEMPRKAMSRSPTSAKAMRMMAAVTAARMAVCRRAGALKPAVTTMNIGARPIGSMVTKRVTRALSR